MTSRWLTWSPGAPIRANGFGPRPTKPAEPSLVGFVGALARRYPLVRDVGYAEKRQQKLCPESEAIKRESSRSTDSLPVGTLFIAPRFDGLGNPLESIPECWCCGTDGISWGKSQSRKTELVHG